ncbi:hypothetical protein [Dactylosporangium sp. CA-139066]|uniref:hypothetical protein n=1 Tax=Dactylosporangium sp. CA-139066 TaxID=3239930 RepID=UPI003D8DE4AA
MHRPGRPEDLEHPDRLWARAATLTTIAAAGGPGGFRVGSTGLHYWSPGGAYWWQLTLAPAGEAVLSGQDSDASHTHLQPRPLDLLAGLPDRLIWDELRRDHRDFVLGYAYWFVDGAWHRVPYPDRVKDDGLAFSAKYLAGDSGIPTALAEQVEWDEWDEDEDADLDAAGDAVAAAAAAFLARAHARTVDAAAVAELVDALAPGRPPDGRSITDYADAALRAATHLGLTGTQRPPMLGDGSATQKF